MTIWALVGGENWIIIPESIVNMPGNTVCASSFQEAASYFAAPVVTEDPRLQINLTRGRVALDGCQ